MARILYLHGSSAGPFGPKTHWLEVGGHTIAGRPRLPYPRYPRRSWRWIIPCFDRRWFRRAVAVAQEAYDCCRPDLIVGVSMGGAVAMNLSSRGTPQVLVAPAWRAWGVLRFGKARQVKPATIILHGSQDRLVFPRYSRRLLGNDSLLSGSAGLIEALHEKLSGGVQEPPAGYRLEGRLVVVQGDDHRCNSPSARRALLAAVEVLTDLPSCSPAG
jgi:hypothetical protein